MLLFKGSFSVYFPSVSSGTSLVKKGLTLWLRNQIITSRGLYSISATDFLFISKHYVTLFLRFPKFAWAACKVLQSLGPLKQWQQVKQSTTAYHNARNKNVIANKGHFYRMTVLHRLKTPGIKTTDNTLSSGISHYVHWFYSSYYLAFIFETSVLFCSTVLWKRLLGKSISKYSKKPSIMHSWVWLWLLKHAVPVVQIQLQASEMGVRRI